MQKDILEVNTRLQDLGERRKKAFEEKQEILRKLAVQEGTEAADETMGCLSENTGKPKLLEAVDNDAMVATLMERMQFQAAEAAAREAARLASNTGAKTEGLPKQGHECPKSDRSEVGSQVDEREERERSLRRSRRGEGKGSK